MRTPSLEGPRAVRKLGAFKSTDMRSLRGFSLRHLTMSWWFFIMLEGTVQLRALAVLTAKWTGSSTSDQVENEEPDMRIAR